MTITERNEQLQDLRKRLAWLRTEEMAVEADIRRVNQEYRDYQMFSERDLTELLFTTNQWGNWYEGYYID